MRSSTIIAGIQRFIKKISQIKIDLHLELKITKIKKRISYLVSPRGGSGATIEVSLAFRNEVGDEEKSEENLYLKGNGKAYGKKVDLYEKVDTSESRGVRDQYLWSLQVFKNSGTVRLMSVDQGGGTDHQTKEFTCEGKKFEIMTPNIGGEDWEKPVTSITFNKFQKCTESSGKKTCDIEIADNFGFKEKNFSAFRNSLGGNDTSNAANDLYLKGFDNKTETVVDFDEDITGEHHIASSSGRRGDKLWQLKIYKESGTHELHSLSGAEGGHYDYDGLTCTGEKFEVSDWTYDGGWEKSVSEISFVLLDCNSLTGIGICDIRIK